MKLSALVLHNVSDDIFFRFNPETSRLFHAQEFMIVADNTEVAAGLIWTLTNVDDANHLSTSWPHLSIYSQQVEAYRRRRNRSLSVSDVIVFHELPGPYQLRATEPARYAGSVAVAAVGFDPLPALPAYEDGDNESVVSKSYLAHMSWYDGERKLFGPGGQQTG